MTSCLLSGTPSPYWKEVYSIRKQFAPIGSKLFPFRVFPFSKGMQYQFDEVASPSSVSTPFKTNHQLVKWSWPSFRSTVKSYGVWISTISSLSFWNGIFHLHIWTLSLMQIGMQVKQEHPSRAKYSHSTFNHMDKVLMEILNTAVKRRS